MSNFFGINVNFGSTNAPAGNAGQGAKRISLEEFIQTHKGGISDEQIDKSYPYLRPEIDKAIAEKKLVRTSIGQSERRGDGSYETKSQTYVMAPETYRKKYDMNAFHDGLYKDLRGLGDKN